MTNVEVSLAFMSTVPGVSRTNCDAFSVWAHLESCQVPIRQFRLSIGLPFFAGSAASAPADADVSGVSGAGGHHRRGCRDGRGCRSTFLPLQNPEDRTSQDTDDANYRFDSVPTPLTWHPRPCTRHSSLQIQVPE